MPTSAVTVSCPSCGGKVEGAEPGRRVVCSYCGSEVHVPAAAEAPDLLGMFSRLAKGAAAIVVAAAVVIVLVVGLVVWLVLANRPAAGPAPAQGVDPAMARRQCLIACGRSCMRNAEPRQAIACEEGCEAQCAAGP